MCTIRVATGFGSLMYTSVYTIIQLYYTKHCKLNLQAAEKIFGHLVFFVQVRHLDESTDY